MPVQFALATDDTYGGDTDLRNGEMDKPMVSLVYCYNTDTGWADNGLFTMRDVMLNKLPTVSIHNSRVMEHEGVVMIPVTVSGTRKVTFSVDWKTVDGTAKLNSDYTLSSGRLSWTSTDNGTRYIEIPIVSDAVAEDLEEFSVVLTASSGTNIDVAESTVSICESEYVVSADAKYSCASFEKDDPVEVDERTDVFCRLARDVETLRFSTEWVENNTASSVRLTVQLDEDNETPQTIHASAADETDGTADWETYSLATGRYLLAHETLDERGGLLNRLETYFFINRDVVVHDGILTNDETWDNSAIHVVRGNVIVPAGVQLSISSGTIVKFQSGCGIIAKLGSVVDCKGVTFTHVADDSIGGDTNLDGLTSVPSYDAYTVGGDGTVRMDSDCKLYCKSATLPSGTLKQNTTLSGNLVYKATGSLTIANGVTLTIEPGAVLKFDSGQGITVNAGATLEAIGTRAQPIVFTSIKDDEHGGDTNQDGNNTAPQPGDWLRIATSGNVVMDYCNVYYGGQLNGSMGDVFNMTGGAIQLTNCEIAHSLHYVAALESGSWTMTNSIVRDCYTVFRHFAQSTNTNCVFYDLNYLDNNANSNLYLNNCVIMNFANDISWWQGSNHFNHCIAFNVDTVKGASNTLGDNGLNWADPLFNNPENGDFTLKANSPCIDAGDGSVAPELDYWGKPRMNNTKINDTGIVAENGCVPDIGVYECPGTGGGELPDLQVNWISSPSVAASGETITVSWQIENVGQVAIQGYWQDSISVCSADENLGQQTVELGDTTGYDILAVGEKKTIIRQCRIPAIMPGKWRLVVTVNSNLDIYERNIKNNRVESEETIDIQVNLWQSGKYYALQTGEDIALQTQNQVVLELIGQQADGLTLRCGEGFLPTETHFTTSVRTLDDGRKLLVLPQASLENTMLLRVANDGANGASFSLSQVAMSEAICDVKPKTLSAQDIVTMSFILLDASAVKDVSLKKNGMTIMAKSASTDEQGRTVAAFDLTTAESGLYGLKVTTTKGMTYSVANAVTVEENAKTAHLEAWLDLPDSVREGRQYIGYIRYKNTGQADMNAPVFRVIGGGKTKVKVKLTDEPAEVVRLYGACSNPINVLRAGEEACVPFYFTFTGQCVVKFDTMVFPDGEYPASATFATWKELETAVHKAALRLYERGQEETDFNTLTEFAERVTVSSFSGISGHAYQAKSHAPLDHAIVVATASLNDEQVRFSVETDDNGYFCFDALPGETEYAITLDFAEVIGEYKVYTVSGQDVNGLEVLGFPKGSINGYVVMSDGQPVEGDYVVELWFENGIQAFSSTELTETGNFEFRNLLDGNYFLKVFKSEENVLLYTSEIILINENNVSKQAVLEMEYPGRIYGMALTENEEPCGQEGLQVVAYGENGGQYRADVQADGAWEIPEIPAGGYRLAVEGGEWKIDDDILAGLLETDDLDVGTLTLIRKDDFLPIPAVGVGPLDVFCQFVFAQSSDGYTFEWDFDGDGVVDSTEPEPQWTYTTTGDHIIDLKFTTPDGQLRQSQRTVTVVEPVGNVLREDVILIHDMNTPPYEFVSWDGTTLVMREVGDYPIKPMEGAKMLFKYPDGDIIGVKILTSRKYMDCYYLTVDDATLNDFFSSLNLQLSLDEEEQTRSDDPRHIDLDLKGCSWQFTIERPKNPTLDHLYVFFDNNDKLNYIAYHDRFILTEKFKFGDIHAHGGVGSGSTDPSSVLDNEYELTKKPFMAGLIPCCFTAIWFTGGKLEVDLTYTSEEKTFVQDFSWDVTGKINHQGKWKWSKHFKKSYTSNIGEDNIDFKVKGEIRTGLKLELLVGGASIRTKGGTTKAIAALGSINTRLDLAFCFDCSLEKQSATFGLHTDCNLKLGTATVKVGRFKFDFNAYERKIWDLFLLGVTWTWGGPVEDFTYESSEFDEHADSYNVLFTTSGLQGERLEKEVHKGFENHYYKYFPSKQSKQRIWNFGDGTVKQTPGGMSPQRLSHLFAGKSAYYVTLQPMGLFSPGLVFGKSVTPFGSDYKCPKCGHHPRTLVGCDCECHGYYNWPEDERHSPILQSCDPNEIVGPRGIGDPSTQRFVKPGEWLDYTIYFENKSTADAAAQEIWINLDLNERLVDVSTFQLGEISFGNQQVNSLNGKATGKFAVTQEGTPFQVRGKVTVDKDNGAVQWYLRSYDPANAEGGYWPAVVTAGFLPPNDSTHRGEGYVRYKVKVREDAPNDAFINAEATIVFDYNEPITTSPAWFNWVTTEENPVADATTLRWDTSDDADGTTYVVNYWSGDPDPTAPGTTITFNSDTLTTGSWKLPDGLFPATWYWNVTKTHDGESSNTSTWSFDILASHTLTVHGGIGSGMYRTNTLVAVEADTVDGKVFTGWTADGIDLSVAELAEMRLVFYMPDNDVTLTANYRQDGQNDIELCPGWNLIAVPGNLSESDNTALFADLTAFAFDAKSKTYVHASLPLTAGEPLWIYSNRSQMIPFVYENTDSAVSGLTEEGGWHLVGVSGNGRVMIDKVLAAWTWNNGRWTQVEDDGGTVTLEARHAYFIYKEKGEATCISVSWIEQYFYIMDFLPDEDVDGDGLTNWEEYKNGTNPLDLDTDGDGMPDGWEIRNNKNPLDANDVDPEMTTARYLVVDLSGGPDAESYPIRYSSTGPDMNDDTCRTTELWLRRIPKGTFIMGSPEDEVGRISHDMMQHEVSLTRDYYIGVFECTQKQWELVMGRKPSYYIGDCRPVDCVSYNMIRGDGWPMYAHDVNATSFMGKLQSKTGLTFDLPTEAQWEYACRAGTVTSLSTGKNITNDDECPNMNEIGRYAYNQTDGNGGYSEHTKVGCYIPNAWGLYDMHGNMFEWCLDWFCIDGNMGVVEDPVGPKTETGRVVRGGCWYMSAGQCRAATRYYGIPSTYGGDTGFRVACLPWQDLYVVVDLSDGPEADNYPVRYSAEGPDLNNDTCRTTELWLRRIPKGTFMMGSPEEEIGHYSDETSHEVTLSQDFYIGVFECTQKQWELVMGDNPSYYKGGNRPVEYVSYNMIRGTGTEAGAGWPTYGHAVDTTSFMGKLQSKTGLAFDLPTEAQWEYACRAGTTTALNSDMNLTNLFGRDAATDDVGRYAFNINDGKGGCSTHTKVGSYEPNLYGLFDMHGNVWEWCLDWYGDYGTAATANPSGADLGWLRLLRGGGWDSYATNCRSACRGYYYSSYYDESNGFRVACHTSQRMYMVSITNGTVDTSWALKGQTVTITAKPVEGMVFDKWVSTDVEIADAKMITTTFTMLAKDVTVMAMYIPELEENEKVYVVVDLSNGPDAANYPVRYTNEAPDLSDDTCRTTELWLRRIPKGTFIMGSSEDEVGHSDDETQHKVTLTQDYYIGVFECTQRQWELVMGTKPSHFNNVDYYETRPVEQVSYDEIRGKNWPSSGHTVNASSFMGRLREKTGLTFDLPTEAQWEYACRAGTTTALNSGKNLILANYDIRMNEVGRYWFNGGDDYSQDCTTANGTAKVGSYLPNAWGLYDMHGNVIEWCLDWYISNYGETAVENPPGSNAGFERVLRGGSCGVYAWGCRSASRGYYFSAGNGGDIGFRIVCLP